MYWSNRQSRLHWLFPLSQFLLLLTNFVFVFLQHEINYIYFFVGLFRRKGVLPHGLDLHLLLFFTASTQPWFIIMRQIYDIFAHTIESETVFATIHLVDPCWNLQHLLIKFWEVVGLQNFINSFVYGLEELGIW